MTTVGYVWGAVAAALSLFGGPWLDAVAELSQSRASREEVARSCRAVGGLAWGLDGESARDGRYGCIAAGGWVACDHHGNCTGGDGSAQRFGGAERRGGPRGDRDGR